MDGKGTETSASHDVGGSDAVRALTEVFNRLLDSIRANSLTTPPLTRPQQEVVLAYQGFRQGLGRAGVSVLVDVRRNDKAADVIDLRGPFPEGPVTIIAYDPGGHELGSAREHERDGDVRHATIPGLTADQVVARVEVLDERNIPILFGGTIQAATASRLK